MSDAYVEQHDGVYRVKGTCVSFDSIVCAFVWGQSAEAVAQALPVLSLQQIYGALTYRLAHRRHVDG